MPTIFHIITGTKGGIGKTMAALSTVWSRYDKTIDAVDVNWHNPDFGKILSRGQQPQEFYEIPTPGFHVWRPTTSITLSRMAEPYVIPCGAMDLWSFIISATSQPPLPNYVIVDTGLHPLNLLTITDQQRRSILTQVSGLGSDYVKIYLWFLWTYSAAFDDKDAFKLGNTNNRLDNQISEWNKAWRDLKGNSDALISPIHVINPHAMYNYSELRYILSNNPPAIPGFREIRRMAPSDDDLSFVKFGNYMSDVYQENIRPENRFHIIYQNFIKKHLNRRPRNVFAIQHYCRDAVDFPASHIKTPPTAITDIVKNFEPFAKDIKYYIDQLEGIGSNGDE